MVSESAKKTWDVKKIIGQNAYVFWKKTYGPKPPKKVRLPLATLGCSSVEWA